MATDEMLLGSIRTPSELYPVVHDLSDAEYGSCCCGETFGSFQLSDLVLPGSVPSSIWNRFCPTRTKNVKRPNGSKHIPPTDLKDQTDPPNNSEVAHQNLSELTSCIIEDHNSKTPIAKNGSSRRDHGERSQPISVASPKEIAPACCWHPRNRLALEGNHGELFQEVDRCRRHEQTHRKRSEQRLFDGNKLSIENTAGCFQKHGRKSHLRRKSRQLMNLLLVKSNSASTFSTKDLSAAEDSSSPAFIASAVDCNELRTFDDTYVLTRQIFKCRYSEIWECVKRTSGVRFCVKVLEQPESYTELDMLQALTKNMAGHPNLIKLVEAISEGPKIYIITEIVKGDNLLTRIAKEGPMDENVVRGITRSILRGLDYLHSKAVVHSDIQPENILLTIHGDIVCPSQTQIADFGSAVDLDCLQPIGAQSGNYFSAPELLQGLEPYDTQADIWSVGAVVYFMLSGVSPFDGGETIAIVRDKILRAEYSFRNLEASRLAKQFIANMIHLDTSVRMTATEAMNHPWLREDDDDDDFSRYEMRMSTSHDSLSPKVVTPTHMRSAFPVAAPEIEGMKHHRRLSSLSKGISKILFFSDREPQPSGLQRKPISDHRGYKNNPPSPARSTGSMRTNRKGKSHRRQMTSNL